VTGPMMVSPNRRRMALALTQPAQAMQQAALPMIAGDPVPGQPMPQATREVTQETVNPWIDSNTGGEKAAKGGNEDPSRDLRSFDSFGDYFNDPTVQKEWGDIARAAMGAVSPATTVARGAATAAGIAPSFMSLDGMGGGPGPGGAGVSAADRGAQMEGGTSPGVFADGGFITEADLTGGDPPGPDTGYVGVHPGEVVLNPEQQKKVGRQRIAKALMSR
jgi:hypothetical protein